MRRWVRGWLPSLWRFRRVLRVAVVADLGSAARLWQLELCKVRGHAHGPVADPRMDLDPDKEFTAALTSACTWAWAHEKFPRRARRGWVISWCLFDAGGAPATGPVLGGSLGAAFGVAIAHLFGLGRNARRRLDPDVVLSASLDDDGTLLSVSGLARKVPAAGAAGVRLVVAQSDVDAARDARVGSRPDIAGAGRIVDALRLVRAPRSRSLPAVFLALVLVAGAVTYAWYQHDQNAQATRQQLLQQLTARSRQDLAGKPASAIFTATAAEALAPHDTAADSALLSANNVDSRLRHVFAGPATDMAMSPDGGRLVTGGADHSVTEWAADQPGKPLRTARQGGAAVSAMAFALDGRSLVTGDEDGAVVRWDAALTPKVLYEPDMGGSSLGIVAVAVSPDGRFAAAATASRSVWLVDLTGITDPVEVYAQYPVSALAFSSPTTLLIGCVDRSLTDQLLAVDIHDPKAVRTVLSAPKAGITQAGVPALAVSADGTTVVSGSMSGDVTVWNAADLTKRKTFRVGDSVVGLATDGTNAVVTTVAGLGIGPFDRSVGGAHVQLWNLASGTAVSAELAGQFLTATTAADAKVGTLAVRDLDGSVTTWADPGGESLRQNGLVADIVPDPESAESVITVGFGGRIDFVDTRNERITRSLDATGHGSVRALAVWGSLLVTAHSDGTILVRDRTTGQLVGAPLTGHTGPVFRLAVRGDLLASGGKDGTVRLWDLKSHQQIRSWDTGANAIIQVAFGPSGRLYIADSIVQMWVLRARLWWVSPDSDRLNGPRDDESTARGMIPVGDRILAGFGDGELRWLDADLRSLPEQIPFRHQGNVNAIAGSGDFVITAGWDKVAGVLHAPEMTPMLELRGVGADDGRLYSAAVTGDGQRAVVGSDDGRIQIIDLDTANLTRRACSIVGRPATAADLGVSTDEVAPPCQ
jgi:WD40 repeat protein